MPTPSTMKDLPREMSVRSHLACVGIPAGLLLALLGGGCATVVKIDSTPPGASVSADGVAIGKTPTELQVKDAAKPVAVSISLPDYFPEQISYTAGSKPEPITAVLAPTKLEKSFEI